MLGKSQKAGEKWRTHGRNFSFFVPKCTELFPMYGCEAHINYTAYRNCSIAIVTELPPFATDRLSLL